MPNPSTATSVLPVGKATTNIVGKEVPSSLGSHGWPGERRIQRSYAKTFLQQVAELLPDDRYWYLAGPMSGRPGFNYPEFDRVAKLLREQAYPIVSPAEFEHEAERKRIAEATGREEPDSIGPSWAECLARDVCVVANPRCVGIILLPEWQDSKGARLETEVAASLGKPLFEFHEDPMSLIKIDRQAALDAYLDQQPKQYADMAAEFKLIPGPEPMLSRPEPTPGDLSEVIKELRREKEKDPRTLEQRVNDAWHRRDSEWEKDSARREQASEAPARFTR